MDDETIAEETAAQTACRTSPWGDQVQTYEHFRRFRTQVEAVPRNLLWNMKVVQHSAHDNEEIDFFALNREFSA